jgi:hypothetical protein
MALAVTTWLRIGRCIRIPRMLFYWNPPLPPVPSKKSTTTRSPPFLDERLLLQNVKRLPSLVHYFAKIANYAVVAASAMSPPPVHEIREYQISRKSPFVRNEKDVVQCYDKTTARFCESAASTLALHPKSRSIIMQGMRSMSSAYGTVPQHIENVAIIDDATCRNPLSCAVAMTALNVIVDEHAERLGKMLSLQIRA